MHYRPQFFPVIGKLMADVIEGVLPDDLVKKFAVGRPSNETTVEDCRRDSVPELDEDDLCTLEDLLL
jgi:sarcosine oxidase/L-pipecolate oxidase